MEEPLPTTTPLPERTTSPEAEVPLQESHAVGHTAVATEVAFDGPDAAERASDTERRQAVHGQLLNRSLELIDKLDAQDGTTDRRDRYEKGQLVQLDAAGFADPEREDSILGSVQIKKHDNGKTTMTARLNGKDAQGNEVKKHSEDHGDGVPYMTDIDYRPESDNFNLNILDDRAQALIDEQLTIAEENFVAQEAAAQQSAA